MRPNHFWLLLVLVCAHPASAPAEEVRWAASADVAWTAAQQEKRPLLIYVTSSACHWCGEMQTKTFGNPDVAEHINKNFVAVTFKAEDEKELAKALEIGVYPTTVILSISPGKKPVLLGRMTGYVHPTAFRKRLAEAAPRRVHR